MLDDFCESQSVAYKILKNAISNNTLVHAYLINTNGYSKGVDFSKAFAKCILCPYGRSNSIDCDNCFQCYLIDNDSFPEFKYIESDGLWIKKDQTDELQSVFSMKSVCSKRRVYVINGVENLNISASNSILKFLEEPEDDIIAILITSNIYNVLNTIVSRCQVINLNNYYVKSDNMLVNIANELYSDSNEALDFINDQQSMDMIVHVIDFIDYVFEKKLDTIVYINDIWSCFFSSKEQYLFAFNIMIMFFNDVVCFKMNKGIILNEFSSNIEKYSDLDFKVINDILNIILDIKNDLFSNVNLGLLMDKFIIKMEEL